MAHSGFTNRGFRKLDCGLIWLDGSLNGTPSGQVVQTALAVGNTCYEDVGGEHEPVQTRDSPWPTHTSPSLPSTFTKKHNCWVSSVQAASLYLIREIDLWKWNNISIHSRDGGGPCALNSPTQLPNVLLKHHIYCNLTLTRYGSATSKLGEGAGIVFSIDFVQKPQEGCMYFMQETRLWPAAGPTKHYSAGHPHNKG